ncbi:MAG: hypothetical protein AB1938_17635 [Myxococcota bacterium]
MRTTLALVALALAGCTTTTEVPPPPPPESLPVTIDALPPMPDGHPDLPGLAVPSPAPRRLSIEQLQSSLDAIGELPPGTVQLPADLKVTLGQPDYLRVTEENLEPTPLFMKFLGDIAVSACNSLSDYDVVRPAGERVMTRFPTRDENLRFMLLRFTALEGAAADGYLPRLQALYDAASASPRPRAGYEAVCMALITSPEFLVY